MTTPRRARNRAEGAEGNFTSNLNFSDNSSSVASFSSSKSMLGEGEE